MVGGDDVGVEAEGLAHEGWGAFFNIGGYLLPR
jgi:hypothetical protein